MAVKMRLMRMGKKKSPYYRVVVVDGRAPRDGRYIDLIGRYDPKQKPSLVEIDNDKAVEWLRKGAQPTESVAKLLDISGATSRFKVASGRIHTVGPGQDSPQAPAETAAENGAGSGSVETVSPEVAAAEETMDETAGSVEDQSSDASEEE